MPGAHGKRKSKRANGAEEKTGGPLIFKEDCQAYATITKAAGDRRFVAMCDDGVERMCKLRGSMRRRDWVCIGDLVLVSTREYGDEKADVLLKYAASEVALLKRYGEIDFLEPCLRDEDGTGGDVAFGESASDDERVIAAI
jgi:translation initiation factor 1A